MSNKINSGLFYEFKVNFKFNLFSTNSFSQQSKSLAINVIIPILQIIFVSPKIKKIFEDTKPIIIIDNRWPIVIKGEVTWIHPDGLEKQRNGSPLPLRAYCKKPFCDDSHKRCDTWWEDKFSIIGGKEQLTIVIYNFYSIFFNGLFLPTTVLQKILSDR